MLLLAWLCFFLALLCSPAGEMKYLWSTHFLLALIPSGSINTEKLQAVGLRRQVVGAVLTHLPEAGATAASQRALVEDSAFRYWIISSSSAFEMEEGLTLWFY